MFDSLSLGGENRQKKKKLSTKQRAYQSLIKEKEISMQLEKNPKSLLDRQLESIEETMHAGKVRSLSKG